MKNKKIHEFTLPNQAKPVCLKFGLKSHAILAIGDNKSTISLWRLNKDRPLATLQARQNAVNHAVNEMTSVCFALNQNELFSGNNAGSFGVWDIRTQQLSKEFKEHSSTVSCIAPSIVQNPDFLVMTGSHDSSVKEWDTRQKGSVATYSEHTKKINCIDYSPDGSLFITGSDDSLLKLWDLRTRKCLKTFDFHNAPITCAKFNPEEITLTTASEDGTLNYWNMESFELMFQSTVDMNGIQQIAFDQDGGHFFTAAKDILRVWRVNSSGLSLLQNIECKWDNIHDLVIQNSTKTPTPTNALIGAVLGQTSFELWGSQFENLHKYQKEPIVTFSKVEPAQELEIEEPEEEGIPMDMCTPQVRGRMSSKPFEHFSGVVSFEVANKEVDDQTAASPPSQNDREEEHEIDQAQERDQKDSLSQAPTDQEDEKDEGIHQGEYDGSKVEENLEFNELLESTKDVRASIFYMEKVNATQLDLSSYLGAITGEDKKNEFDAIGEISKDHAKFEANMIQRAINVRQMSSTWKTERALKTLPTIEKLGSNDSPMILSLITISVIVHRIEKLPLEIVCELLRKVPILMETNFDLYIRVGLGFSLTVLEAFDKEIVPRKPLHTPKKVGVAKGEIPRRYVKLINAFEWFLQQEVLKKLATKGDTQLGKIAKKAQTDFTAFLKKVGNPTQVKK